LCSTRSKLPTHDHLMCRVNHWTGPRVSSHPPTTGHPGPTPTRMWCSVGTTMAASNPHTTLPDKYLLRAPPGLPFEPPHPASYSHSHPTHGIPAVQCLQRSAAFLSTRKDHYGANKVKTSREKLEYRASKKRPTGHKYSNKAGMTKQAGVVKDAALPNKPVSVAEE